MDTSTSSDTPGAGSGAEKDLLDRIRREAEQAFEKDVSSNNWFTGIMVVVALCLIVLWGCLWWNSESPKWQTLWALFFVGEMLGIGLGMIMYMIENTKITLQTEHRRLELQVLDLQERVSGLSSTDRQGASDAD